MHDQLFMIMIGPEFKSEDSWDSQQNEIYSFKSNISRNLETYLQYCI